VPSIKIIVINNDGRKYGKSGESKVIEKVYSDIVKFIENKLKDL